MASSSLVTMYRLHPYFFQGSNTDTKFAHDGMLFQEGEGGEKSDNGAAETEGMWDP